MSDSSPAETIFYAALEKASPAEQVAYLDRVCAGQPELRAKIEKMLAAHPLVGDFLNLDSGTAKTEFFAAHDKTVAPQLPPVTEGMVVAGRYKLLQQIGEGGMGSVWMADQTEPVKRRVAVKLIRVERGTSKMILSRFEAERQAIALMDHPHIAKLLDAGTTDVGQPYFVMELVKGIPLTDYCDQHKLGIPERLALFQQVCSAVQHAHQKGIIHRDLKPSNVLVESHDGQAVPKVIDFGLAKATSGIQLSEHTLFTAFGTVMGTPTYMAPEQATFNAVDVDTRADVYSLGVILYELLTGTTPITRETAKQVAMDEVLKLVREQDAPKPSSRLSTTVATGSNVAANRNADPLKLSKLLKGDLDWIVLKALEKDRKRRYESANGLAADIQRHLANEPVTARPPSTAYRLQKAWQRNKVACTAGAAIAASLLIGIVASLWQASRATLAERRAVAALDELRTSAPAFAEQARALATAEQFDKAIEKLDYAIQLRPDAAEYFVARGDLLQCQFKLKEAATAYREALRVQPDHARAKASAQLCDELLAAKPAADGKLSRESLAKLHLAMQSQQRPAAELMPVARLLGAEKQVIVDYWLARLKDLPVSSEKPLAQRLTVREDGRLALDLARTRVVDLSPLAGAPLATLDLANCPELSDISALRGLGLLSLNINATKVMDLSPLSDMRTLAVLHMDSSQVADLSPLSELQLKHLFIQSCPIRDLFPLRKMRLESIHLSQTRVADLSPLAGMPIRGIALGSTPVLDFSPLAELPLEHCLLQFNRITDLNVFRGKPLKQLSLWGCAEARNYSVLAEIPTLELLLLPSEYRSLPDEELAAIGQLRTHAKLRQIGSEVMNQMGLEGTSAKDVFWKDWDREQAFLAPLSAAGIKYSLKKLANGTYHLTFYHQPLRDLSSLKGAPISELDLIQCPVAELTPLAGMPLASLTVHTDALADLTPLRGLTLTSLSLTGNLLKDFSPLTGLPLKRLTIERCANGADVSALAQIATLEEVVVPVHAKGIDALHKLPKLKWLANRTNEAGRAATTADEYWKDFGWISRLSNAGFRPTRQEKLGDGTWDVDVGNSKFSDLALFQGARLSALRVDHTPVTDLSPLRGMPLKTLEIAGTSITDLSPLAEMPLRDLRASGSKLTDLAVLRGLPLVHLKLHNSTLSIDLAPLADCQHLETITLPPLAKNLDVLRRMPRLKRISYVENNGPDKTAAEFWKEYDANSWVRKLTEAGYVKTARQLPDGTWEIDLSSSEIADLTLLQGTPISRLQFQKTAVADLSPLRGMPLKQLNLASTKVTDLSPLQGLLLDNLVLSQTPIRDLSPLRGMPLTTLRLHACPQLTDLSPLAECQELLDITLPPGAKDFEFLRGFTKIVRIGYSADPTIGYRPDRSAAQFWREQDAKKK